MKEQLQKIREINNALSKKLNEINTSDWFELDNQLGDNLTRLSIENPDDYTKHTIYYHAFCQVKKAYYNLQMRLEEIEVLDELINTPRA